MDHVSCRVLSIPYLPYLRREFTRVQVLRTLENYLSISLSSGLCIPTASPVTCNACIGSDVVSNRFAVVCSLASNSPTTLSTPYSLHLQCTQYSRITSVAIHTNHKNHFMPMVMPNGSARRMRSARLSVSIQPPLKR